MKKMLYLGLSFALCLTLLTGCGCSKKADDKKTNNGGANVNNEGPKANTSNDVIKNQTLGVFKFENTSLIYEDGNSKLQTTVTNTSDKKQDLSEFIIHVKDAEGKNIVDLKGFVGDGIEANSSKVITSVYGDDLTTAASIEYEIPR